MSRVISRGGAPHEAAVRVALAPVRGRPSARAELVTQWPMGVLVALLRRWRDWRYVRGPDGYFGWVQAGALRPLAPDAARAWRGAWAERGAWALDATVTDRRGRPLVRLPWGARVLLDADGAVRFADGRCGLAGAGTWVREADRARRFPARGRAVCATARTWLGVPYLWGGATRWGADCSGFVQAVFGLHGVPLPRDSAEQARAGVRVGGDPVRAARPGDLFFFRGRTSGRIVHVAIVLGGGRILHAAEPNGEVAEDDLGARDGLGAALAARVAGVRRVLRA